MVKADTETKADRERMLNSMTEIVVSCREPSGGKITQGVREIWVVMSFSSSNACSSQMFASNINYMPNTPLCSSLQLQLPLHNAEVESECLSIFQESVQDNIKKLRMD